MINEYDYTRLAVFRDMRGMTQAQVAKLMGTKKQAVSDWELGRIIPSAKNLAKYCNAVQVNPGACFVQRES